MELPFGSTFTGGVGPVQLEKDFCVVRKRFRQGRTRHVIRARDRWGCAPCRNLFRTTQKSFSSCTGPTPPVKVEATGSSIHFLLLPFFFHFVPLKFHIVQGAPCPRISHSDQETLPTAWKAGGSGVRRRRFEHRARDDGRARSAAPTDRDECRRDERRGAALRNPHGPGE